MHLFFVFSVRTLPALVAEQLVNGELDRGWKGAVTDNSSYYPSIWVGDQVDTTTNPTQDNRRLRRDSNGKFS